MSKIDRNKVTAAGLLIAAFSQAIAQTDISTEHNASSYRLGISHQQGCSYLADAHCEGAKNKLRLDTPSRYYASVEQQKDEASFRAMPQTYELGAVGRVTAHSWQEDVKATVVRVGKVWEPSQYLAIGAEAYAGQIQASLLVKADVQRLIMPQIPKIPSRTIPPLQYVPDQFTYDRSGKTNMGGLRQYIAAGTELGSSFHAIASQSAQYGIDRKSYGASVGLAWTSNGEKKLALHNPDMCNSKLLNAQSRWAFAIAACAERVTYDAAYTKVQEKAAYYAGQLNNALAQGQVFTDQYKLPLVTSPEVKNMTGSRALELLNVGSPLGTQKSLLVMMSFHMGHSTASVSYSYPLMKNNYQSSAQVALGYGYNF